MSLLGAAAIKYVKGHPELGRSPETGFDCSGFVTYVLRQAGLEAGQYIDVGGDRQPIRHANEYWDHYGIAVHEGQHQPGDLVFFTRDGTFPSHVGIVTGADEYIHSPGRDNSSVRIVPMSTYAADIQTSEEGRILYARNPIGFKSPVVAIGPGDYRHVQKAI